MIILFNFEHRACLCPRGTIWARLSFRCVRERGKVTPLDQNELVNPTREVENASIRWHKTGFLARSQFILIHSFSFQDHGFFLRYIDDSLEFEGAAINHINPRFRPLTLTLLYTSWNLWDEFFNWFYRAAREIYGKKLKIKILHKITFWIVKKS